MIYKQLKEICTVVKESLLPVSETKYYVYSLPAFDNEKRPEILDGASIKSSKFVVRPGLILFNKLNVQNKRIWFLDEPLPANAICSTEFIPLFPNATFVDPLYLFYFLQSEDVTNAMYAARTGTSNSQQRIKPDLLLAHPVPLPNLETQRKIGRFLYNLDCKIRINAKINGCLEAQANTLFQGLLSIPDDDSLEVSLADLMDYAGGSQPPASEFITEPKPGYVRFVQIRDYDSNDHVTYIPVSTRNKICDETDIMIARYGASLGKICFGINGAYNVALAKVFPKKKWLREYLRCYLSSHVFYEGINGRGGRSAQAGFNASDIASFRLRIPKDDLVLQKFEKQAGLLFRIRLANNKENVRLTFLRDSLLPKLMSGEISVDSIDIS